MFSPLHVPPAAPAPANECGRSDSEATVVILTAGQSPYLASVIRSVQQGFPNPARLLVIWSGKGAPPKDLTVETFVIPPKSFDHGGTRQMAIEMCRTDVVCFLADDAEPVDEKWLQRICIEFHDPKVGVIFGRHQPRWDADTAERVFRVIKYPVVSATMDHEQLQAMHPLSLPISDANAAYRRSAVLEVGGFPRPCPFGEDIAMAMRITAGGWKVHYAAEAAAWHSHSLSWGQTFERGMRSGIRSAGISLRQSRGFKRSAAEGRLMLAMLRAAWKENGALGMAAVASRVAARTMGYLVGRMKRP
jgi:rhamnosyltransferase